MKEKLQEYALIAEIIGGIAIVASLVFVGLQIQHNTIISQVGAYQEITRDMNAVYLMLMDNSELNIATGKARANEELSITESGKINAMAFYMFNLGDMAYKQYENGLMSEEDLIESLDPLKFWMSNLNFMNEMWVSLEGGNAFDEAYYNYVNENILN